MGMQTWGSAFGFKEGAKWMRDKASQLPPQPNGIKEKLQEISSKCLYSGAYFIQQEIEDIIKTL